MLKPDDNNLLNQSILCVEASDGGILVVVVHENKREWEKLKKKTKIFQKPF